MTDATETDHLAAVMQALTNAGGEPYTIQDAKRVTSLPLRYNEVTLEPRPGNANRTARTRRIGYRLVIKSLGRTSEGAREMREAAWSLVGAELTVADLATTPIQFESSNAINDDDDPGWLSGALVLTYAH